MQYSYNIIVDSPCEITADFAKANQLKVLHFTYTEGNGDEGMRGRRPVRLAYRSRIL